MSEGNSMNPIDENKNIQELMRDLLLREDFRDFVIKYGKGDSFVLDAVDNPRMPNSVFVSAPSGKTYNVVSVDERRKTYGEREYASLSDAYRYASYLCGLTYFPPSIVRVTKDTLKDLHGRMCKVYDALKEHQELFSDAEFAKGTLEAIDVFVSLYPSFRFEED